VNISRALVWPHARSHAHRLVCASRGNLSEKFPSWIGLELRHRTHSQQIKRQQKLFSASRALRSRSSVSKLEVERKFVPSPLLNKYASETATVSRIHVTPTTKHNPSVTLTRLPRKRITDKYFDHKGQLEQQGIWVRWRKGQTITHDGSKTITSQTSWEAKVKQGGNFLDSQFVEAKGRDAVEDLMAEAGVCHSIYDLSFQWSRSRPCGLDCEWLRR